MAVEIAKYGRRHTKYEPIISIDFNLDELNGLLSYIPYHDLFYKEIQKAIEELDVYESKSTER